MEFFIIVVITSVVALSLLAVESVYFYALEQSGGSQNENLNEEWIFLNMYFKDLMFTNNKRRNYLKSILKRLFL